MQAFEAFGYYYHGSGLARPHCSCCSADGTGAKRDSDGYMAQLTYKIRSGEARRELWRQQARPGQRRSRPTATLVRSNRKATGGMYYSLTKNLTLLAEYSNVRSEAQNGGSDTANTFNIGAFVGF